MAVEPEDYDPNQVAVLKRKACVVRVQRGRNGNWRVTADLEIELRLPDGRLVTAWEEVKLRGRGEHKPRPDPTWLYEGKRGRARKRGKDGRG
jgi:hypothetical protein